MADVPPTPDRSLAVWAVTFDAGITAAPERFGLSEDDAAQFHALREDYVAKLDAAADPATRGRGTVASKNDAKRSLLARARQLVRILSAHPGVTPAQRVGLGLNVRDTVPTPVPAPLTKPFIIVEPDGAVRLVDESMTDRRGKPAGVKGAVLLMRIVPHGDPAPASADDAQFALLTTRNRCAVTLPPNSNGKMLWVLARWFNDRGELGPVSPVVGTTIAA